jgi:hypothetical protein
MALPYVKNEYLSGPMRRGRFRGVFAANGTIVLPLGFFMERIWFKNRTANAVTGGIRIGTSAAGTQVVTAQAVAASVQAFIAPTISGYSLTQPQVAVTLFVEAVTAWNSANVDVVVEGLFMAQANDTV